jgi:beta-carotene 15,15'-dioxygenase
MNARHISMVWSLAAVVIALGFGVADYGFGINMSIATQLIIVAFSLAILGLSHGGLDHLVAQKLWVSWVNRRTEMRVQTQVQTQAQARVKENAISANQFMIIFLFSYSALALLTVLLWWLVPALSLCVFLVVSALHFGDDMRLARATKSTIVALALGTVVIVLPWTFHTTDVATIFAWLTESVVTDWTNERLKIVQSVSLLITLVSTIIVAQMRQHIALDYLECFAVVMLFCLAPPLVAFALFFSFLHANQHMLSLAQYFYPDVKTNLAYWRVFKLSVPLTLIALFIAALIWFFKPANINTYSLESTAQLIFIGLAALTMPHMLVVTVWSKFNTRI